MTWKCPDCGGTLLQVSVATSALLTQDEEGNFETEVEGNHEWDGDSHMSCEDCGHKDLAKEFEVHEPVQVNYGPEHFRVMDRDDLFFLLNLATQEMDNTREDDVRSAEYQANVVRLDRVRQEIMAPSIHESISAIVKP